MIPPLRFPEFAEPWRKTSLAEFFTFKNGVNAEKGMYGSGRKFINVMDVIAGAPITHDAIIGSVEISDKDFAKNEVKYGDVLFQRSSETRAEVGQSNIYLDTVPATFGGFVIRGRPKTDIEPRYFDALLKTSSVRKDMTSRSGGSTRYNIGQESLEAVQIHICPTPAEQVKIADFLGAVDERIKLLQRRHDALARYKSGLMQRLFDQSLRFTRDDGTAFPDWEEKRVGELGKTISGLTGKTADDFGEGQPYVTYKQIFGASKIDLAECLRVVIGANENQNLLARGDVLFTTSSETPNEVGFASILLDEVQELYLNSFCFALRPHSTEALVPQFARYLFRSPDYRRKVFPLAQGSTRYNLAKTSFLKLRLGVPHPDEQRKIADALSALDDKIAAVTDQIKHMQTFKKGLLQQMFV
jgi:type I restriction enzyme, S subunit